MTLRATTKDRWRAHLFFLGCSDVDFHVPKERVDQTAEVLRKLSGEVTERLYPHLDHSVNQDEIGFVRDMMQSLITGS